MNGPVDTLSGNSAKDGGGLDLYDGQAQLFNVAIGYNRVQLAIPKSDPGIGGGVTIDNSSGTSVLTAENSIIARNTRGNSLTLPVADDCYPIGITGTLAFDPVTSTSNCFTTGPQQAGITGEDPLLGVLRFNGGPAKTQLLLPGSPAIDSGATAG